MIENSLGRDLYDGGMVESSGIREPHLGEDGEVTEGPGGIGLLENGEDENPEPYEGMEFESEEAAKVFYDAYARRVGFIIRVSSYCRSKLDGAVISRRLVCNKEGFKKGKIKRPLAVTREGCKAMINVKRQRPGKWIISKFEKDHSHPLLITSKVRRNSHQNRSSDDAKKIRELSNQLHCANQRCAIYREHLEMILKGIEEHTHHLSGRVQDIVHSIRLLESEEQQQPQHRQQF